MHLFKYQNHPGLGTAKNVSWVKICGGLASIIKLDKTGFRCLFTMISIPNMTC